MSIIRQNRCWIEQAYRAVFIAELPLPVSVDVDSTEGQKAAHVTRFVAKIRFRLDNNWSECRSHLCLSIPITFVHLRISTKNKCRSFFFSPLMSAYQFLRSCFRCQPGKTQVRTWFLQKYVRESEILVTQAFNLSFPNDSNEVTVTVKDYLTTSTVAHVNV